MNFSLPLLRKIFLRSAALFSFILFILSCVVVPYENRTYGGYNGSAAELIFAGLVGLIALLLFPWLAQVRPNSIFAVLYFELFYLTLLWIFIIGGVGALTSETYHLLACQNLFICRGYSTMLGFGWMIWICLTLLIGLAGWMGLGRWAAGETGVFTKDTEEVWEKGFRTTSVVKKEEPKPEFEMMAAR